MVVRGASSSALERIGLDETIAERLLSGLADDGVSVLENTEIDSFELVAPTGAGGKYDDASSGVQTIQMALKGGGELTADLYLACLGRVPRARGTSLGLEAAGVALTERAGHIVVNQNFETSREGIYAAGDCSAPPPLGEPTTHTPWPRDAPAHDRPLMTARSRSLALVWCSRGAGARLDGR